MSEQRRSDPRVGVEVSVEVRVPGGGRLRAHTENLSRGGAMLGFRGEHGLESGDEVELDFELPRGDEPPLRVRAKAKVRWTSSVLPEVVGVAFTTPLGDDASACLHQLAAAS